MTSGSVSTRSAALRAAAEPWVAMPIPTSAVRMAATSLLPSPVMATTCPLRCSAVTMRTLCSGLTLAKTVVRSMSAS